MRVRGTEYLSAPRRRVLLITLTLLVSVIVSKAPVAASNFGYWWADIIDGADSNIRLDQCNLSNKFHNAFHDNDTHDIEATDIGTDLYHSCDTIDIYVNDYDYGDNRRAGWWECHRWYMNVATCDQGHVHINTYYDTYTQNQALSLMCEEIGHAFGLEHRDSSAPSCMSQQWDELHLDSHDRGHLNANY
jgi:hypothetical protein